MSKLNGKVAIVTGAASGIGLACAKRYADEGAIIVGCATEMAIGGSACINRTRQAEMLANAAGREIHTFHQGSFQTIFGDATSPMQVNIERERLGDANGIS